VRAARPSTGRPVTFTGSPSHDPDDAIVSYLWHFGGGRSAAGRTVAHTFARPGSYRVWLTVRDSFGTTATTATTVTVRRRGRLADARRPNARARRQA
jgi:PKD domain